MSKQSIKATINANIKQNGVQAITGQIMNSVLNGMVDNLAAEDEVVKQTSQTLTPAVQAQVRQNIGAIGSAELDEVSDKVTELEGGFQTLTGGEIDKDIAWSNGYVSMDGIVKSSSLSKYTQPFLLKKGEKVTIGTQNTNITIIGKATSSEPLNVGGTVTPISKTSATSQFETYVYTAEEDTYIVLCVLWSNHTIGFSVEPIVATKEEVNGLTNKVDEIEHSFVEANYMSDSSVNRTGNIISKVDFGVSDYISVNFGDTITWHSGIIDTTGTVCLAIYDAEKKYIEYYNPVNTSRTITFDSEKLSNMRYIRISFMLSYQLAGLVKDGQYIWKPQEDGSYSRRMKKIESDVSVLENKTSELEKSTDKLFDIIGTKEISFVGNGDSFTYGESCILKPKTTYEVVVADPNYKHPFFSDESKEILDLYCKVGGVTNYLIQEKISTLPIEKKYVIKTLPNADNDTYYIGGRADVGVEVTLSIKEADEGNISNGENPVDKLKLVSKDNNADKDFVFACISDIHNNGIVFNTLKALVNDNTSLFDMVLCCGDLTISKPSDNISSWYDVTGFEIPYLQVIGNHDAAYLNNTSLGQDNLFQKWIKPLVDNGYISANKTYYYKDFDSHKTRIIVLNEYEASRDSESSPFYMSKRYISSTQLQWFADALFSTPVDYHVIVALHSFASKDMIKEEHSFSTVFGLDKSRYESEAYINMNGNCLCDIVDAYINGTIINKTYSNNIGDAVTYPDSQVVKDFSVRGKGNFVCYVGGHLHEPMILHDAEYPNQRQIQVPAGIYGSRRGSNCDDIPYANSIAEDNNFYGVSIDTRRRCVKLVKFGVTLTTEGRERKTGYFKY